MKQQILLWVVLILPSLDASKVSLPSVFRGNIHPDLQANGLYCHNVVIPPTLDADARAPQDQALTYEDQSLHADYFGTDPPPSGPCGPGTGQTPDIGHTPFPDGPAASPISI